jgi:hypothetical protein
MAAVIHVSKWKLCGTMLRGLKKESAARKAFFVQESRLMAEKRSRFQSEEKLWVRAHEGIYKQDM